VKIDFVENLQICVFLLRRVDGAKGGIGKNVNRKCQRKAKKKKRNDLEKC
jgi:hypothetical protein